jgi:hypothetical protein
VSGPAGDSASRVTKGLRVKPRGRCSRTVGGGAGSLLCALDAFYRGSDTVFDVPKNGLMRLANLLGGVLSGMGGALIVWTWGLPTFASQNGWPVVALAHSEAFSHCLDAVVRSRQQLFSGSRMLR